MTLICGKASPIKFFKRKFVESDVSFGFVFFFFKLDLPNPHDSKDIY